jgi:hypothetical protein
MLLLAAKETKQLISDVINEQLERNLKISIINPDLSKVKNR